MGWKIILCWMLGVGCLMLSACVAKKKAVESTQIESAQISHSKDVTESQTNLSTENSKSSLTAYDFGQIMGNWSLGYDGEMGDGFRFYMNQTENGWEAGAEGKGTATAETQTNQINSRLEVNWQERFDSLANVYENRLSEIQTHSTYTEKIKITDKISLSPTTGMLILGGFVLLLLILLFSLGWKLRNLSKTVQAFLNFKNLLKDGL